MYRGQIGMQDANALVTSVLLLLPTEAKFSQECMPFHCTHTVHGEQTTADLTHKPTTGGGRRELTSECCL